MGVMGQREGTIFPLRLPSDRQSIGQVRPKSRGHAQAHARKEPLRLAYVHREQLPRLDSGAGFPYCGCVAVISHAPEHTRGRMGFHRAQPERLQLI